MKTTGPKRLHGYLTASVLKRLSGYLDEAARVRAAWQLCVPEPLVSHSQPISFTQGRLTVHVDTSAWASRLRQRQQETMQALRRHSWMKNLKQIQVRVHPSARPTGLSAAVDVRHRPSQLEPHIARLVHKVADDIADPGLRTALQRLGADATGKARRSK